MKLSFIVPAIAILLTTTTAIARAHPQRLLQDTSGCQAKDDAVNTCLGDALNRGTLVNATFYQCLGCQNDFATTTGTLNSCDEWEKTACNVVNNCGCGPCLDEIRALQQCQADAVLDDEAGGTCALDCSSALSPKMRAAAVAMMATAIGAFTIVLY